MKNFKKLLFLIFSTIQISVYAQSPKSILQQVVLNFYKVKDYSADIAIKFDIPGLKIEQAKGKVFYKQPDKFKVKSQGIIFLPKQNPFYFINKLRDTTAYECIGSAKELVRTFSCHVINVVPTADLDFVLAKFWIDEKSKLILRSQITTKANGTVIIDNVYQSESTLPINTTFTIDVAKFKIPKAVAVDINSKSSEKKVGDRTKGFIVMSFANYKVNQNLNDAIFTDETVKK
jgi:hypothetical protein